MISTLRLVSRLRTSSGCFVCRKRRKKCDESTPRCAGCVRNNFKCVWPAPESVGVKDASSTATITISPSPADSNSPFADDSSKVGRVRSPMYGLPWIRTSMDHYLSIYFRDRFMTGVFRPNAHPAFQDPGYLILVSAQMSTTMGAFLATAAMHASWANPKFRRPAIRYYNSVLAGLRKSIAEGAAKGGEDWLLLATNLLVLFEINKGWNTGHNPLGAAPHLDGLAHILKIRIGEESKKPQEFVHLQNKISAESFVLWSSFLSLFYSEIDRVGDTINWNDLNIYLDRDVFPDASISSNSPLLVLDWKLHGTIFEISRLSHKVPLETSSYVRGRELETELIRREKDVRFEIPNYASPGQTQDVLQQILLYILATQILVFKTLRPETRTCNPRIREIVTEAMAAISRIEIEAKTNCGPYFCWPLAILSCAVESKANISSLRDALKKVWLVSYCGEVQRVRNATEVFWQKVDVEKGEDDFNLLDILIYQGGMFKHPSMVTEWGKSLYDRNC
ncbi:uncharacterized protein BP5553_10626 [Venustampulla echinocandica]|uniref:Zn(2)-C6 fungal-type domain-containing protein n=1 Tax=Venustampulla echinocandica TaxID=2656787 RepID=A0A370T934_9HELO|nr:uncharacterized protein BP5553_10626 [Venustampulla echinocandica]RDL29999.1 hypothetical protein BP5553_10626 [Venustampulla echinocandica]